ncbi:MAG: DUF2924 domain-containing protein [Micavibrio sp.]
MTSIIENSALADRPTTNTIQIEVPTSWGGFMPLILADENKSPNEHADMYMVRQFARLQFTSTTELKLEYKRRFFEMCPEYITREDLIFKLIQRIHLEHYTPEVVLKDIKKDDPVEYARQVLQMATKSDKIKLPHGIVLLREYKRKKHEVFCLASCYLYKTSYYKSLTEIAQRITQTQISGPMFFKRKTHIYLHR